MPLGHDDKKCYLLSESENSIPVIKTWKYPYVCIQENGFLHQEASFQYLDNELKEILLPEENNCK